MIGGSLDFGLRDAGRVNVAGGEGRLGNIVGREFVEVQVAPVGSLGQIVDGVRDVGLVGFGGAWEELVDCLLAGLSDRLFPIGEAGRVDEADGCFGRGEGGGRRELRIFSEEGLGFFGSRKGFRSLGHSERGHARGSRSFGCRGRRGRGFEGAFRRSGRGRRFAGGRACAADSADTSADATARNGAYDAGFADTGCTLGQIKVAGLGRNDALACGFAQHFTAGAKGCRLPDTAGTTTNDAACNAVNGSV